jgi:hypothetical protein
MAKGNGKGKVPDGPSGLGALFSKKNEKQAAEELNKGYEKGYKVATKELKGGFKGLKKDYAAALDTISKSADQASGYVAQGRDSGVGAITQGRDAALGEFDPYVKATAGAPQLYSDALGLGGAEGNARAVDAFRTGPGYDFRMDQGMEALQRLNASRGRLDSGNTMIDAMDFAGGLADQEYGSWLDRLAGEQEFGANIAGGRAGIYTGAGQDLAGIYTGAGSELAGIATNSGTQRAAIKTGRGDAKMSYGSRLADLGYATRLGQAATTADYLSGLDAGAMNAIGTVGGVITGAAKATGAGGGGGQSLGARLLGIS